jgi:hypothetical protein
MRSIFACTIKAKSCSWIPKNWDQMSMPLLPSAQESRSHCINLNFLLFGLTPFQPQDPFCP